VNIVKLMKSETSWLLMAFQLMIVVGSGQVVMVDLEIAPRRPMIVKIGAKQQETGMSNLMTVDTVVAVVTAVEEEVTVEEVVATEVAMTEGMIEVMTATDTVMTVIEDMTTVTAVTMTAVMMTAEMIAVMMIVALMIVMIAIADKRIFHLFIHSSKPCCE
jgi:hypothetical protein